MVLRSTYRDLWNPILRKDGSEVDHAMRDSGKGKYSSTMKLLMQEFEKKDKLGYTSKQ